MSTDNKVILVTRRTRLEELVAQYNTEDQAAFVIKSRGGEFEDYRIEHNTYMESVSEVEAELKRSARVQRLERGFLPNFIFGPQDKVVVVGPDGLVANTLKYLNGQPVIAINPDPARFDGVLLPFSVEDTKAIFSDVLSERYQSKQITMAKATLNDGQELIGVNDLFIGPRIQISARYELSIDGKSEVQSSSGIIVSTGLGSTGWMKSIVAGAVGVMGGERKTESAMAWNDDKLKFAVREPFPSQATGTDIVCGEITQQSGMRVSSLMAGNGVIFSDGMVDDAIEFNSGVTVNIRAADQKGVIVV
ncbi:sugar kinase [Dasania sp. GY-MA-18]|uniref:Sugar kinase n=1 Tax=Dasania phycosphaerae TaxID=2950436 RepID=A0A9J6RL85_9GAMM|nr:MULTISPECIES: sugar kinase [Dasania]MCR8922337.1 sugar kinase [Dasania sp. GY-MA-18]MCZ0864765.1 sugar kinase [Dasania phycosphaerae]MCZ0868493.1 sugar kinase [Dasania phycosphaerae]